jgi:hypothetical protein
MDIRVHIERLIVDEALIGSSERAALQTAVAVELTRLLAAQGLGETWRAGGAMPYVRGGTIQPAAGQDPAHLGLQVAQAVYGGIGRWDGR